MYLKIQKTHILQAVNVLDVLGLEEQIGGGQQPVLEIPHIAGH
jgi:hypothetical protein